jgi:hypothetical protein
MMSGVSLEICWAFEKVWNNKFYYKVAFCWLFLLIHTTMHGSMNIKFPNCYLYHTHRFPLMKGGSDHAVTEALPHKHVDLPQLLSGEVTGVRLAAVKSPRQAWRNTNIIAPWNLSCKWILTDDLNAKHLLWESAVPNTMCEVGTSVC